MTSLDTQLWELIATHKMPDDAAGKPFTNQLMAENRISRETATVAIAEYRKFMYLCAARPERNVPSKAVDLVWHLHLQHSRDYWDVFCKKLGRPIHHTPGGQGARHLDDYNATVEAYEDLFGPPPKGIWKRINKPGKLAKLAFFSAIAGAGAIFAVAAGQFELAMMAAGFLLISNVTTFHRLSTKGEMTLVFESNDPFANNDAGDCGSGDCGGCGD